jgi:hypothetical protein
MAKSILQTERECFFCGTTMWLEEHHVFGAANRKKSEKYGLKVWLCHRHHNEPPCGVHFDVEVRQCLQDYAQRKAMYHYKWDVDTFRNIFGKNYLITEE